MVLSKPLTQPNQEAEETVEMKIENQLKLIEGQDQQNHFVDSSGSLKLDFSQEIKGELVLSKLDQSSHNSEKEGMINMILDPDSGEKAINHPSHRRQTELIFMNPQVIIEELKELQDIVEQDLMTQTSQNPLQQLSNNEFIIDTSQLGYKKLINSNANTSEDSCSKSLKISDLNHTIQSEDRQSSSNSEN